MEQFTALNLWGRFRPALFTENGLAVSLKQDFRLLTILYILYFSSLWDRVGLVDFKANLK